MVLIDQLRQFSEQVKKRLPSLAGRGEEATKQALVLPFIQLLGFDPYDPGEVQPEFVADFAKKKAGQFEKVDYAIRVGGEPRMFIECKAVDVPLEDCDGQLARYFNSIRTVMVGLLSNGLEYRFYTDLREPNVMDKAPFLTFDVRSFSDREFEVLRPFTKELFDADEVRAHAEELVFIERVTVRVNDLLRNPSEDFVRFLVKDAEVVTGYINARVVERFLPIVKKAIHSTVLDMMTKGLQAEIAQPVPMPSVPPASSTTPQSPGAERPPEQEAEDAGAGIADDDRRAAFRIVQRLCGEIDPAHALGYRDNAAYFSINLGRRNTWFLRLYLSPTKKQLQTRLAPEQAALLAPGFQVEPAPDGRSRMGLLATADLDKLRALVLRAFEDAIRRAESEADEDEADEESVATDHVRDRAGALLREVTGGRS
jgi:hypothetical protein